MCALLDGNNYCASCKRIFRPSLQGWPLLVFSNNDGYAIARSDQAKASGIKMRAYLFLGHLRPRVYLNSN